MFDLCTDGQACLLVNEFLKLQQNHSKFVYKWTGLFTGERVLEIAVESQ